MVCEKYTNCEYCGKDYHCSYDYMGDGSLGAENFNVQWTIVKDMSVSHTKKNYLR